MPLMLLPVFSISLILLVVLHVRDCLRWDLGLGALFVLPGLWLARQSPYFLAVRTCGVCYYLTLHYLYR